MHPDGEVLAAPLAAPPATPLPAMAAILRANASALGNAGTAGNATAGMGMTTAPPWGGTGTGTLVPLGGFNNTNLTLAVDDEFSDDLGYSDLQIVFLACVFTAAPLLAVLLGILAARFVWRKFQRDGLDDELDGMLRRTETHQSMSQEQLKTSESQFTVLDGTSGDLSVIGNHSSGPISTVSGHLLLVDAGPALSGTVPPHRQVQHNTMSSRSSNGSVITLTMHNNHLIVEKEEIVESSQEEHLYEALTAGYLDQKAIVHEPPPRPPAPPAVLAQTGLSQPDSSADGETPPYAYGNQVGYDSGPMGYPTYNGYRVEDAPGRPQRIAAATVHPPRLSRGGCLDSMDVQDLPEGTPLPQRLLSDIQAHQHALEHQRETTVINGDAKLVSTGTGVPADVSVNLDVNEGEDVCSVKAQSPPKSLSLGLGPGPADQPLPSPVVAKLRQQDASPLTECFPAPATSKTPPPPRSPLALDGRGRSDAPPS